MDVLNDPEAQKLIKREIDEGHVIASHTYTHPESKLGITALTDEELTAELKTMNDIILELTGLQLAFFRSPLGMYNDASIRVMESLGFIGNIIWNLDSNDWREGVNATANYFKYLDK